MSTASVEDPDHATASGIARTWREAPRAVKVVVIGILINRLGGFFQVFIVLYLVHRGYTSVHAGIVLGAYFAGSVVGALAGGWLTARFGPRRAVVSSMIATAVLTAAFPYAPDFPALTTVAVAVGATGQIYRPASADVVGASVSEQRRVMVFAMYRLATNLGATAAPLLGAALVAASYSLLFWGEALAALGCALLSLYALPADPPIPRPSKSPDSPPEPTRRSGGYAAVLRDRYYLLFLAAMFGYAAVYNQYISTLPLSLHARGVSTWVYSALIAVNGLIIITCELLITRVVQHWSARIATVLGMALVGFGMSAYGLGLGVAGLVAATMLWSIGETVGAPTMVAYPTRIAPPRLRSRYVGASQAMFGVGSCVGPALGVAAWSLLGQSVWPLCGAVITLSACAAATAMRGTKQNSNGNQSPHELRRRYTRRPKESAQSATH